ncbi:MAG: histidine kinase dimerization/phospho-acceptor domain-containing protein, partial [Actinomycetota bacterium]
MSLELRLVLACALVALAAAALVTAAVVPAMARWMDDVEPGQRGDLLLGWVGVPALFAVTGAAAVGWWVGSVLVRPLRRLTAVVRQMADGDRSVRVGDVPGREPAELGRAIDTMADALVRQEAARQQMVDDVAHELRTPLAALQAGLEELRDGLVEPDPATLAALHDQSQRLGRVVADLGALAAAEAS